MHRSQLNKYAFATETAMLPQRGSTLSNVNVTATPNMLPAANSEGRGFGRPCDRSRSTPSAIPGQRHLKNRLGMRLDRGLFYSMLKELRKHTCLSYSLTTDLYPMSYFLPTFENEHSHVKIDLVK